MSNNSNNGELAIIALFALVFLAVVAWVAQKLGLDFTTSTQVVTRLIFFGFALAIAIYFVKNDYFRFVSILPVSIVGFLSCWLPALSYWANENMSHMDYEGYGNSVWYATGWIQGLIAITIIVGGHGLIYYIDSNRDHH